MSIESWKKEYFNERADVIAAEGNMLLAAEHSLKKWRGLQLNVLQDHGLVPCGEIYVRDENGAEIKVAGGEECALCELVLEKRDSDCGDCILSQVRDGICCYNNDGDEVSPYKKFTNNGDASAMVALLEKAVETLNGER